MATTRVQFIDLQTQYSLYKSEIDDAIADVIRSSAFIQGPEVAALESELAAYVGAKACVSCSSGTDALLIALLALGIGPGDEVIVPAFTFFATAEMPSLLGARPVFVDIRADTCTINTAQVAAEITERTRAIIPVGLYGQPADMDEILELAARHRLAVIDDAAQSFGARYRSRSSGSLATVSCTSFYPAKPLGCYGDGGALFTDDAELDTVMRQIMNHGQSAGYRHARIGINGRLDALQAAVLRVKLKHFDDEVVARQEAAARYSELLAETPGVTLPHVEPDRSSVYAQYTVKVPNRDAVRDRLAGIGIPTAVHYPLPVYKQRAYSQAVESSRASAPYCPVTENACRQVLSLPFSAFISKTQQELVASGLRTVMEECSI